MSGKKLAIIFAALLLVSVTATAAFLIPAAENAKANSRAGNAPVINQTSGYNILDTPGLEK